MRLRLLTATMLIGLALPGAALADGGPVQPVNGGPGVAVPGHTISYVAIDTRHGTLVQALRHGSVVRWNELRGHLGVPGAAFDGSTTGLSADGRTLVLAGLDTVYPPRNTRLVVLDPRRLRVRERIALRGFFTVDAISPDGRRLFLIHYTHGSDVFHYEVRAYDVPHRKLLAQPVVDPREPDEAMRGIPFSRAMSPDGRWAYTLYSRMDDAPFIHALDTQAGTAACVDLDGLPETAIGEVKLVVPPGGGPLRVEGPAGPVKLVDTRTFAVSDPPPRRHGAPARSRDGTGIPSWTVWAGAGAAVVCLALVAAAARRRRYRSSAILRNAS
jgi:hypothetical protein